MLTKVIATATAAVIMTATIAAAATVNIADISGVWTNVAPTPGVTGSGTDTISWGDPATSAGQSSYVFDDAVTPINNAASPFYIGDFTHNNNPVYPPSLTSADLMVTITGDIDGTAFSLTSTFTFNHNETTNSTPCNPPGATVCPDVVTIVNSQDLSQVVNVGGLDYTIVLSGFLQGGVYTSQFITEEGQANTAQLYASVTQPAPVPLPAAGLLLLGGLGALRAAKRRRSAA